MGAITDQDGHVAQITSDGRLQVEASGSVAVTGELEIKNDTGNPVPVSATNLDIAISALRDAITGTGGAAKTLADIVTAVDGLEALGSALNGLVDALEGQTDGLEASLGNLPDLTGTWGYAAGTSGSRTLSGSKRVVGIAAASVAGGSMTINGGDSIPLPANLPIAITPTAQLVDPTLVFTSTDSYFVEHLS